MRQWHQVVDWKDAIAQNVRLAWEGAGTYKGPTFVNLRFFVPMSKTVRQQWEKDRLGHLWRDKRPDLDKLVRAALNGIALSGTINDDDQFVQLVADKLYATTEGGEGLRIRMGSPLGTLF